MFADTRPRSGLLVIRIWTEAGDERNIRARVTSVLDVEGPSTVAAAASIDDIAEIVTRWAQEFVAAARGAS